MKASGRSFQIAQAIHYIVRVVTGSTQAGMVAGFNARVVSNEGWRQDLPFAPALPLGLRPRAIQPPQDSGRQNRALTAALDHASKV